MVGIPLARHHACPHSIAKYLGKPTAFVAMDIQGSQLDAVRQVQRTICYRSD